AALGGYDEASGRYTLYAGSGGSVRIKTDLAGTLGVPESAVRVVAREVGGNYGTRNAFYPEFALVAWAAKRLGRPIKWTCDRTEAFLTDYQARDLASQVELALDAEGNFLALRGINTSNVGAHAVSFIPLAKGVAVLPSLYRIPAASLRGRAVLSNTPPTYPYRRAGAAATAASASPTISSSTPACRASAPRSPCSPTGGSTWCWARCRRARATRRASRSFSPSGSVSSRTTCA